MKSNTQRNPLQKEQGKYKDFSAQKQAVYDVLSQQPATMLQRIIATTAGTLRQSGQALNQAGLLGLVALIRQTPEYIDGSGDGLVTRHSARLPGARNVEVHARHSAAIPGTAPGGSLLDHDAVWLVVREELAIAQSAPEGDR